MSMPAERLSRSPNLAELLEGVAAAPPLAISGIASDSRRLAPGNLFLACRGERSHGLDYAREAIERGVAAIAWEDDGTADFEAPAGVTAVAVRNLSAHLGEIANRWFDTPSASVDVTGVTGTNGKTTVAFLIARCLELAGRPSGYVGTLGAGVGSIGDGGGLTTPDCVELHRALAGFREAGARHAAIEVSSHGLTQRRVDGVRFGAAVFTNLSRDHIDYHGSMAAYGEIKARLFLEHEPRIRIIGLDTEFGHRLARRCGDDAIVVAAGAKHDPARHRYLFVTAAAALPDGSVVDVDSSWGSGRCRLPLVGAFNVRNAAAVLALLVSSGIDFDDALELLGRCSAPPGRMQRVVSDAAGPEVFVDYAHTPAALEAALTALAPHCRGALTCVFGCGGDRDRGKRPQMGEVAQRHADAVVVTSDNPRSEEPGAILREILAGMRGDAAAIEDRAAAIAYAIATAADDDVVLIAGKGHEDYQVTGGVRRAFSDYRVAAANLDARRRRGEP